MRRRLEPSASVELLALHQAGVVTTGQLREAGLSRHTVSRLVREGRWSSPGYGLYVTGPGVSWEALAWAGHLVGGEGSRLGPWASGHVAGLVAEPPAPLDVLVPWESMVRSRGPWVFRRERPGARGAGTLGSPPRLTVEDAVLDLSAAGAPAEAVTWVTRAVQRRLTTPGRLRRALDERSRCRNRRILVDLLTDVGLGAESALEVHYLREVERPHALPRGARQRSRTGLAHRTDVIYPPYPLIVELDGRAGHEADGQFRDMERDNLFLLEGQPTLRFGFFAVLDRPCAVAEQVARGLRLCGWPGSPVRCPRCPLVDEGPWQVLP